MKPNYHILNRKVSPIHILHIIYIMQIVVAFVCKAILN